MYSVARSYFLRAVFFVVFLFKFEAKYIEKPCCSHTFWHLTDLHIDQNYSRTGNPHDLCHEAENTYPDNGQYGNFLCDSPLLLAERTIQSMHYIKPDPNFVIWTGDNVGHFSAEYDVIYEAIKNTTQQLKSAFPNVPIIPSIGNHDTFPPSQLRSRGPVYRGYLRNGAWNEILPKHTWKTFLKGGYFSYLLSDNFRIISLNTILWYSSNYYTKNKNDPSDQLEWLENLLKNSTKNFEKVYIIGHVAPGFYNRVEPNQTDIVTYHTQHLKSYIRILENYADCIKAQMYGHTHLDYFQIFKYNSGIYKGSSLISSSVTPWHTQKHGNFGIPVNPSVRLVQYIAGEYSLEDYEQYYLDLGKVNRNPPGNEGPIYHLLYKFRETYDVPDLTTSSLVQVYEKLASDEMTYGTFYRLLSAGKVTTGCNDFCKLTQLCAMSAVTEEEYAACRWGNTEE